MPIQDRTSWTRVLIGSVVAMTVAGAAYLAYKGLSEATVFGMFTLATVAINAIVGTLKQDAGATQAEQKAQEIKQDIKVAKEEVKAAAQESTIATLETAGDIKDAVAKVEKAANGLSDKRAAEARSAGIAEGKASERATVLAAVAVAAPEVVPVVAAKLP